MNKKNNQRSRNTEELIVRTTFAMMTEKKKAVNRVTVSKICEQTGINRSTFYAHYQDVYDVVEKVEQTMAEQLTRSFLNKLEEGGSLEECYTEMFRFIRDYHDTEWCNEYRKAYFLRMQQFIRHYNTGWGYRYWLLCIFELRQFIKHNHSGQCSQHLERSL